MRLISRALIFSFVLLGCTTASSAPTASEDNSSLGIWVVVTSMNWPREQWWANADSTAGVTLAVDAADVRSAVRSRRAEISQQDFVRVRAAMTPLRRFIGVDLSCHQHVEGAAVVSVYWLRADGAVADSILFFTGCDDTLERREIAATLDEADRLFHQATGLGHPSYCLRWMCPSN